jgi:hypothetical protein
MHDGKTNSAHTQQHLRSLKHTDTEILIHDQNIFSARTKHQQKTKTIKNTPRRMKKNTPKKEQKNTENSNRSH